MLTTAPAIGTGWECCSRACLRGGAEEKPPPWPTSLDGEEPRGAGSTPAQGRSSSLTGVPGTRNDTGDLTGKSGEGVCRGTPSWRSCEGTCSCVGAHQRAPSTQEAFNKWQDTPLGHATCTFQLPASGDTQGLLDGTFVQSWSWLHLWLMQQRRPSRHRICLSALSFLECWF